MRSGLRRGGRIAAAGIVLLTAAALAIALDGLLDDDASAELAIVPGNTVEANGEPSLRLRARLDAALLALRQGRCRLILVSGGRGKEGFDEAAVMRGYLLGQGVAPALVITDSDGRDTWQTARFAAALMRERGFGRALVVSQFFHVPRLRLALAKHGVVDVGQAHARFHEARDAYSLLREVFAYGATALRPARPLSPLPPAAATRSRRRRPRQSSATRSGHGAARRSP